MTDDGLLALGALTHLRSLHLGGACTPGPAVCASLARCHAGLTSLQLTGCAGLADAALFKLAPLAPSLRRLGLNGCSGVTDIGLVALLKWASRLTHLELAGCHRNITGIGLQVGSLRRLKHLNLAGCDAITGERWGRKKHAQSGAELWTFFSAAGFAAWCLAAAAACYTL